MGQDLDDRLDVLTIGETMVALRGAGPLRLGGSLRASIAGAESTVAIGLSRLGHRTRWVSRVGRDEPGELILRTLRAEGVDTASVSYDSGPTGLILFERRLPDVTRVQYYRAGSAASRLSPADVTAGAARVRLVHLTGITPALGEGPRAAVTAALDEARERGAMVSFDVNYRSRLWEPERAAAVLSPVAAQADLVIGSADEVDLVGGAGALLDSGVREVVTKLGAGGASVQSKDGQWHAPAHRVTAVDSVGAGDAFTAGYLSALLDGLPEEQRLARGNACGAFAVATVGDWEGLPTRDELDLLAEGDGATLR